MQCFHNISYGFHLSIDVDVFVSCLKVNSCKEKIETLSAAFTKCTATSYMEEKWKNKHRMKRMRTKYIVLNREASEMEPEAKKSLLKYILGMS